jgi:outer membrane receptor protein involved in Fe transport
VPILADVPGARALNFEGAFRASSTQRQDYNTWKYGGDWEPTEGFRVRASQARSVRAPVPTELSGTGLTAGVVNDPCTAARRNNNPTRAANCAADGVPADYAPPLVVEQSVSGITGGNPNLNNERATTLTYGFVFQPKMLRGFTVTLDRFDVELEDIITAVGRQVAANKCYDTVERVLCNQLTRGTNPVLPGATWVLRTVNQQSDNLSTLKISGFDLDVRYAGLKLPAAFGEIDTNLTVTTYDKASLVRVKGDAPINLLGQAGGSTDDQGWIKLTAAANIGWRLGALRTNWNIRYIGSADMDATSAADGYPRIPAHTYHNLRFSYDVLKGAEVYAGINNVFDKQPPFFGSGRSGTQALDTIPGYYDVFGRSYFVGARVKF